MKKLIVGVILVAMLACGVAWGAMDYTCFSDCIQRYSYDYCRAVCSYNDDVSRRMPRLNTQYPDIAGSALGAEQVRTLRMQQQMMQQQMQRR